MPRASFVTLALSLAVGLGAAAQQRSIRGKVVSAATAEPTAGASVAVAGTPITALTNDRGEFSLSAPEGAVTLLVRAVGFKHAQIPVAAGVGDVTARLEQDVFNLEAVVITGQATGVEQRNLANAVTTVSAAQLNRAPTQTLESALQGKVPGALVQMNSGAPGGGGQIAFRGVTTINAGVDPLIVVDGLVIANDAIASNMNAITAAAGGGNASNQDNPVNRLADLNPNDIQDIQTLKGASAAAIYGSQAANGVIIITTRRGRPGAPRFSVAQRFGTFGVANKMGARKFNDTTEAFGVFAPKVPRDTATRTVIRGLCNLPGGKCPFFDNEQPLYGEHQLSAETDASVTGGNDQTTYYLSGLVKKDGGIAPNTGYQKQSIRANLDQALGSRFKVSLNLNAIHDLSKRGISNNDNTGTSTYLVYPTTPSFLDLRPVNGVYPVNPFAPSNPLQTFAELKNSEDVWRILGTSTAKVDVVTTPTQHLVFNLTGGLDFFSQRNDVLSPANLQYEPFDGQPGTVVLGKANDLRLNLVGSAVHTYTPASNAFQATTSAGFQYENRDLNLTNLVGRTIALGLQNVSQATSLTSSQSEQPVKNMGIYGQEEVLLADQRLLLTAGIRADRSSVNGDPRKFYFFPKAAASYRFVQPLGGVDELKLRAAWGQTGNPPLFGGRYVVDSTQVVGGQFGQFPALQLGDPNIKPERNTEIEAGLDATFGKEFATLSVSLYRKTITDLLLVQSLAPSTGYASRIFNAPGAQLSDRGIEIAAEVSPVRKPEVNWIIRGTFDLSRNNVDSLPVPAFNTLGFGTSLGAFRIEQGKSATQIVGSEGHVGDANPDFRAGLSSDLTYKQLSLGFTWEWKHGGDIINLTQLLYDAFGNSVDQVPAGDTRISTWADSANPQTKVYVQDGSYLKLRELTVGYDLPPSVPQHFGMRTARISFSGRNLLRFTPYKGLDPEVSNFGNQAIGRNIDVAPFPPNRSFFFSIDVGF
ncbi:MAG TPA: SusC/RagA family TonB-linked outer membrane protein [Gemmatimonadales bacterium]|nr:SusC/RagA family TonB-linked outer membrane protein [Gemmatimonadales bacterium]